MIPLGRVKLMRLPWPRVLVAPIEQTENIWLTLRYFSMMPLQLRRPNL